MDWIELTEQEPGKKEFFDNEKVLPAKEVSDWNYVSFNMKDEKI